MKASMWCAPASVLTFLLHLNSCIDQSCLCQPRARMACKAAEGSSYCKLGEAVRVDVLRQVIGRSKEVSRVVQVLARRSKNNPILLGDPGVGKTAIAEGLARAIVTGAAPCLSTQHCCKHGAILEARCPWICWLHGRTCQHSSLSWTECGGQGKKGCQQTGAVCIDGDP